MTIRQYLILIKTQTVVDLTPNAARASQMCQVWKKGNLTIKKTKSHWTTYEYYYVQHYVKEADEIKWCYLGRHEALRAEYKEILQKRKAIHNNTQHYTQNNRKSENLNSRLVNENKLEIECGVALVW